MFCKKTVSKKNVLNFIVLLLATTFVQCGGGSGSAHQFSFDMGSAFTPSASLSGAENAALDTALANAATVFQVVLYTVADGAAGTLVYGPATVSVTNADANLYALSVPGLGNGNYFLEYRMVRLATTAGGADVTLASVMLPVSVITKNTALDLSNNAWSLDYDQDQDGLLNLSELAMGTDIFNPDSDSDGVLDGVDAFPSDVTESADTDGDGVGQNRDNCPDDANANQTDQDTNGVGDACDIAESAVSETISDAPPADSGTDTVESDPIVAVYVSTTGDATVAGTSPDHPTSDLVAAVQTAATFGVDVYLSGGTYLVTDLALIDGVSLYGGYAADFATRDPYHQIPVDETVLEVSGAGSLRLADFITATTLSGLTIQAASPVSSQELIVVSRSLAVTLQNLVLNGNAAADSEVLLSVSDSQITVTGSRFVGAASESAVGLVAEQSSGAITNSIFTMGDSMATAGLILDASDLDILNNTIDGGRHDDGAAYGLMLSGSSPHVANNIFLTKNYDNQASIDCAGSIPTTPVTLSHNLFLRYSSDSNEGTGSGYTYAAYVTCQGKHFLTSTTALQSGAYAELSANDNSVATAKDISSTTNGVATVFDSAYNLVVGSPAIGAGGDVGLTTDLTGKARTGFDLGALDY